MGDPGLTAPVCSISQLPESGRGEPGLESKGLSENRLGEGDSPILLRGLRKIGTVPVGSRIGSKDHHAVTVTTMFSRHNLVGLLSLALLLTLAWDATCQAATRVALVSGDRRDGAADAVDLALTKLGADERFVMLERDEIRRVLEEQKLTASGLVDATQVIAIGKLLTTDLFAVVEAGPGDGAGGGDDTAAGLIVFDARSGVRYWDAALPNSGQDLEVTTQAILSAIGQAADKRSRQQTGLHTVGFVTVRNADLPRSEDGLCEAVGFLAERGLPRSPDVAVLERRRLEHVNAERSLPAAEEPADLVASLSTIEPRDRPGEWRKGTASDGPGETCRPGRAAAGDGNGRGHECR